MGKPQAKLLATTALGFALMSSGALGADVPVFKAKAPPAPSVYDWSGFYVGGHAGYGVGAGHTQMILDLNVEDLWTNGPRGGVWGVQAGYNQQIGRMVYGIEGDWSWMNAKKSNSITQIGATVPDTVDREVKSLASLRGRIGITSDQLLLYATMGVGWMESAHRATIGQVPAPATISLNRNATGLVFGAGGEWALGNGLSLRAEYLRYVFGSSAGPFQFDPTSNANLASAKVDSVDVVRVGVNYNFFKPVPARMAPSTAAHWTGFYLGGHAGYGIGAATTSLIRDIDTEDLKAEGPKGGLWGAQAGYNHQIGRMVYGIEGDWSSFDASSSNAYTLTGTTDTSTVNQTIKSLASVRGRVGITADQLLLYATAGWGWARSEFDAFDSVGAPGFQNIRGKISANGLVFGGGAELSLGNGFSARAEYLRYAFGGASKGPILFDPTADQPHVSAKLTSVDVVRIGLNYNFNQRPATQVAAPPAHWTGVYVGGHGGYGVATATAINTLDAVAEELKAESPDGAVFGAQAGYNLQFGRMVYGIEGDWSGMNASSSNAYTQVGTTNTSTVDQKIKSLASVRGRVGITADQLLLYATVGWGWAQAEFNAFNPNAAPGFNNISGKISSNGIVFGGGAEIALGHGLSARAEYLRYALGKNIGPIRFDPTFAGELASYRLDSVDVVRMGLNYRFNVPMSAAR